MAKKSAGVKTTVKITSAEGLEERRKKILAGRDGKKIHITVCSGTGCRAYGSEAVYDNFAAEIKKNGLQEKMDVRRTGCPGFCERGTLVVVKPQGIFYQRVRAKDVPELVQAINENTTIRRLLYTDAGTGAEIVQENEVPFYKKQKRLIIGDNGLIDPTSIDDYLATGGYKALARALKMKPEQIIAEIKQSNLRGRGGAGFPTGMKWATTRSAPGDIKYVIVNADEGDPGAFMDRAVLEGNPHRVLEGLIIGACAIGAKQGFVYVRQEYPLAVENLQIALKHAGEYGFLGKDILGSGFDFDVTIHRGAGAFVSGESSALMTAIEGKVGEPRPKYIRTAVSGIWERPSNLNNVETWATVPLIINNGAEWFKGIGTKGSSGTKIFSLVGKVINTGLVEVPMGVTLRDIIFGIGGGIPDGHKFKAVQTGGPSGGVIPEGRLDLAVDYDELARAGSMMGSGGMIVMDETTCMVDIARYFLDFLAGESCGKCTPCREGIHQMLKILNRLCAGKGEEGDIGKLEEIAEVVQNASLCALGQTAANPVLSTLRYFRGEYEAHIKEKRCPAGACKSLTVYSIDAEKCKGCGICLRACPVNAVSGEKQKVHVIDNARCTKCGACYEACPERFSAVAKFSGGKPVDTMAVKKPAKQGGR